MVCPFSCHYNFMTGYCKLPCYDTFSRIQPGPPLSSNVPDKSYKATASRSRSKRPTTYLLASLIHERCHPFQLSVSASSKDKEDTAGHNESDSRQNNFTFDVVTVNSSYPFEKEDTVYDTDEQASSTDRYQPMEEPWLLQLDVSSHTPEQCIDAHIDSMDGNGTLNFLSNYPEPESSPKCFTSNSEDENVNHQANLVATPKWCFPSREYPVEDPWLLYSPFEPSDITTQSVFDVASTSELPLDVQKEQQHQASEKLISRRESDLVTQGSCLSTEILINCSICTMQRIAVLEDGNLVELLLEPVKCNVQCDSVYLGVVTKLVPHMGGAFVHIGSSRPSLMEINSKREPFIFPPFGTAKETDLNHSSSCIVEQVVTEQDDTTLSDDDLDVDFEDGDFDEHEHEYGIDLGNQLSANVNHPKLQADPRLSQTEGHKTTRRIQGADEMWALVRKGTKIVVQVVKEGLGTKGPTLTAYPKLRSRFWILITHCNSIGVSKKISGVERTRLRVIAKSLQPPHFGVTVRTVAAGHSAEELRKDLEGLLSTWRNIMEHAKSAALAADEGVEDAVPVILHQAMGQTLSVVQDYFNEKVHRMVVDSPRTYHEVTNYLQSIAPDLCERVELHRKKVPLFNEYNIEEEINNIINKRVALPNGGSLVIEQTEALVSIDVNGGHGMFGQGASQEKAILDVNLAAAKQIARELRLRDIGGIIVVDFIDMMDDSNKRLIYEQVSKAVERDRSTVKVSELSKHGLMEITRKRVRPSVTFMISEPCTCCHGTGRVEALETSFSKIEHEICSLLATMDRQADPGSPKSWPRLLLRVDTYMCDYLTSGKRTKLATLSSSLKVWILLKVARSFTRGAFELKLLADESGNNSPHQVGTAMLLSEAEASKSSKRTKLFTVKKWKAGSKG
ncbi:hypothetical protein RND81_11G238900 [Saponaria officinalis]|uniref:RNA-binding protein AU-1/Ribonuclease E/G domain-containing protein n=2 Tax=Saponaria officinalis TaxID=3572 RepID=A0AAW1HQR4_SAPOF